MKKILLVSFFAALVFGAWAQERTVSGKVTSSEDGSAIPGVNVLLRGTAIGGVTDATGGYTLSVPESGGVLVFSFIGFQTQEVEIGSRSVVDVVLLPDVTELTEVVVTALGIERQKAALGYSVQEVSGSEISATKESSFISSLSGRVAGLSVRKSNSLGGSVNAVIRGSNSFTGNNQALFVVDGIPISNSNLNTSTQMIGGGGYDYGNAASDIDPNNIESISVLKGATAAALYGSDAANGVIMITTKKGTAREGLGITVNHATTFSQYDKATFPKYQKEYGAGYGPYYGSTGGFYDEDVNGDGIDDLVVPAEEDASFGAAYDPSLMVYQWDSFYPELDTYLQPRPWVAPEHGPEYIFETGINNITNVSLSGGSDKGTFRLGYTRDDRSGILPNSKIQRNMIDIYASQKLTDKLTVDGKLTYTRVEGKGRYGTGYESRNVFQSFKQWYQTNVDVKAQRDAYFATGKNITWNPKNHEDTSPRYFDNPYWVLYENYQNDKRNRLFGKFQLTYDVTDWLNVMYRSGVDIYSDLQEERFAIGSIDPSEYMKYERQFEQYSNDVILSFNRDISESVSFDGLAGMSVLNRKIISTSSETNGGLVVPGVYALSNSVSALAPPAETDIHVRKYGYYAQARFGYNDFLYLDLQGRIDKSSTLPEDNNTYFYPSSSLSFIFSELMRSSVISFGKVRAGFARVSNDAPSYSILNTYTAGTPFGSTPVYYLGSDAVGGQTSGDTSNNPELKPETTDEIEIGLEMNFLNNRVGFDLSFYKTNTIDQIMPVEISQATGYNYKYVNAGEMENKGVELSLFGYPVQQRNFSWRINANWARNKNTVVSLYEDGENLLIFSAWSTAINARKGEPYGTITGTNYVYHENGGRIVGADGKYLTTASTTEIIGNIQPDWTAGINNTFTYKNLSFSFLIDIQKGGDIISYDLGFGRATGLYAETAGLNDRGFPKRSPVAEGGGVLVPGVLADGSPNTIYADASDYTNPQGYYGGSSETGGYLPDAGLVYDASFVKLREVTLSYSLPKDLFSSIPVTNVSLGVFGRNLWIIDKNLPSGDPEYGNSSGNYHGIQNAALPAVKEYGFNVNIQF